MACRELDRQTYPDAKVVGLAQKMVPVKIDVDKQEAVYKKYKEPPTPTIMFMDPKGNVIHSVTGFEPPQAFVADMQKALSKSAPAAHARPAVRKPHRT